jgi:hypothetical protein
MYVCMYVYMHVVSGCAKRICQTPSPHLKTNNKASKLGTHSLTTQRRKDRCK